MTQLFTSCGSLETIWATSFDNSAIASYTSVLYDCNRLVGQTGYVPTSTAGKAALSFGSSGVLTNPASHARTWVWAHLYEGGVMVVTGTRAPDPTRAVLASGRVCTNAHYQTNMGMPWYSQRDSLRWCMFAPDIAVPITSMDYWFYSSTALETVVDWQYVTGLQSMRQTFNGCTQLIGGNVTAYSSSATGYARMAIDRAGQAGYLTASA